MLYARIYIRAHAGRSQKMRLPYKRAFDISSMFCTYFVTYILYVRVMPNPDVAYDTRMGGGGTRSGFVLRVKRFKRLCVYYGVCSKTSELCIINYALDQKRNTSECHN